MKAFGMNVVGINRTSPSECSLWGIDSYVPLDRIEEAGSKVRFIVVSLALGPGTEGIIGERVFRAMERGCLLINVARGPVVDRQALEKALDDGLIAGAGLDVLWEEPHSPDDPLLNNPKVVVTPHIGGVNDASFAGVLGFIAATLTLSPAESLPFVSQRKRDGAGAPVTEKMSGIFRRILYFALDTGYRGKRRKGIHALVGSIRGH